jgi:hypothetical protein
MNTMKKNIVRTLFVFTVICLTTASDLFAQDVSSDPKIEALLNNFMNALLIADEEKSAKECMKYVHKSLLNQAGNDLSPDLRRFSFKKAHDNAKFYQVPVKVTRVRPTNTSAIGFGPTAEAGTVHDYFVGKKEGVNGMPAPIKVFIPSNGGEPKVSYMGSL